LSPGTNTLGFFIEVLLREKSSVRCGILNINKPAGISSRKVVDRVAKLVKPRGTPARSIRSRPAFSSSASERRPV
jgi:hypothetical protein